MSMMTVPSLAPGARTLPGELRVPGGNAWGWHRLHQNLAPLTEPPTQIPVDPRIALSGLGEFCDDSGICYPDSVPVDYGSTSGVIYSATTGLPVDPAEFGTSPTVIYQNPNGTTSSQTMTPAQLTALINAGSSSLLKILAVTQGGSVTNSGIYGATQTGNIAASFPANQLSIGGAGISGALSSPMLLIGVGLVALLVLSKR